MSREERKLDLVEGRASRRTVIKVGAAAIGMSMAGIGGVAKANSALENIHRRRVQLHAC